MLRLRILPDPAAPNGAGDGTRTRDIQLGRLELYQLSYARLAPFAPGAYRPGDTDQMVGREGFEPSKALGRQIYSLMRLTASLPPRRLPRRRTHTPRAPFCAPRAGPRVRLELAEGIEPPTR